MGDMLMQQAAQLDEHPMLGRAGRVKGTREIVVHLTHFDLSNYRQGARSVARETRGAEMALKQEQAGSRYSQHWR